MSSIDWVNDLRTHLSAMRHRQCIVLCGDTDWRIEQLALLETQTGLWLAETSPINTLTPITHQQLRSKLGQEIPCAVFCAEDGIDADALGIISGMIQAGGILWILIPSVQHWLTQPNPANARFLSYPHSLSASELGFNQLLYATLKTHAIWFEQHQAAPKTLNILNIPSSPSPSTRQIAKIIGPSAELSADQQAGLDAIMHVGFGHPKRPLLIEADRGRGKTSLLGEAAVQLLLQGKQHIVITASRLDQVSSAFRQAENRLKTANITAKTQPGLVEFEAKKLEFRAPDDLAFHRDNTHFDMLMIDEAAHLPVALLQQLVMRYPRVVLSTTLHGYEGSGRGFSLKFKPFLDQQFKTWHRVPLQQPIRWNDQDPLEAMINQALLLDADIDPLETHSTEKLTIKQLDLLKLTPVQLKPIFGLLVQAHYQTSPADLQQYLSAPDLCLYVAYQGQACVGVLLITREGALHGIPRQRRVKGHLVPQLLRQVTDEEALMSLKAERVMRLAVHPGCQRQGVGTQLIEHWLVTSQADYACASFGVSQALYPFWRKLGFHSAHLGAKRDKASGTHNLIMLKPLKTVLALDSVYKTYQQQLAHSLMEFITELPPGLVVDLLAEYPENSPLAFNFQHYLDGTQLYEAISHQLWQWTRAHAQQMRQWPAEQQAVWLDKVLRKQDWQQVARAHKLAGRKGVESLLKQALAQAVGGCA
ncbi:GNAT family N-acetyltransferase [Thiomicrospira sp. R3]|uniref:GNAT family N-acetyltransferase n=1 Tax=Thiomicrospira sp. R3 TaxID=3035472 RepID=UPI00259B8A65|nr:GNAT family N-acetyltransferase [Thiomicrospira sp. R3]WFE69368.1 GNAT family N-acetyltransferase [Thiomicrospira sp. R3]